MAEIAALISGKPFSPQNKQDESFDEQEQNLEKEQLLEGVGTHSDEPTSFDEL